MEVHKRERFPLLKASVRFRFDLACLLPGILCLRFIDAVELRNYVSDKLHILKPTKASPRVTRGVSARDNPGIGNNHFVNRKIMLRWTL